MHAIRYLQIKALAESMRLRDMVKLGLFASRYLDELIEHTEQLRAFYDGQIQRRTADFQELLGRRSVELEAAAREGYRQAVDARADFDAAASALDAEDEADFRRDHTAHPLDLVLVEAAARKAKPTEVLGELTMVGRARHG